MYSFFLDAARPPLGPFDLCSKSHYQSLLIQRWQIGHYYLLCLQGHFTFVISNACFDVFWRHTYLASKKAFFGFRPFFSVTIRPLINTCAASVFHRFVLPLALFLLNSKRRPIYLLEDHFRTSKKGSSILLPLCIAQSGIKEWGSL